MHEKITYQRIDLAPELVEFYLILRVCQIVCQLPVMLLHSIDLAPSLVDILKSSYEKECSFFRNSDSFFKSAGASTPWFSRVWK